MADSTIKLTPEGERFMKALKELENLELCTGFQGDEGSEPQSGKSEAPTVLEVAAWNELGTSRSPARPFLRQTLERKENQLKNAAVQILKGLSDGNTDVQGALNQLGVISKGLVQKQIRDGDFVPNAPSTVERKHSSRPLIDSGTMRQSVNYVVRSKR